LKLSGASSCISNESKRVSLATSVLAASVSITFEGQLQYVVPGAIKAMVPVLGYLLCFLVLRKFGYRLLPPELASTAEAATIEKANLVTIRDMFILTAALAVLFAGLSPWLPGFSSIYQSLMQVLGALVFFAAISLAPVCAWCLGMSRNRLRLVGCVLFLAAVGFLIAWTAYRFAGNSSMIYTLFGVFPSLDILPAYSFATTYLVATCFALRGWRFVRHAVQAASAM